MTTEHEFSRKNPRASHVRIRFPGDADMRAYVWGTAKDGRTPSHGGVDWPQVLECTLGWGFPLGALLGILEKTLV